MAESKLIGPFKQIVTFAGAPNYGPLKDDSHPIELDSWIRVEKDRISDIGLLHELQKKYGASKDELVELDRNLVAIPGIVDPHTHICWAGNRAKDYSMRLAGKSYLEIAQAGGGIWDTVQKTRKASLNELAAITIEHAQALMNNGTTTIEVKSGYGLTVDHELKMLQAIQAANAKLDIDLVATCLAAHILPKDFQGTAQAYLEMISHELLPEVWRKKLAKRVDIFIEESAFNEIDALSYLKKAQEIGFDLAVHADQFTTGGSKIAIKTGAISMDHLEASNEVEIEEIAKSGIIPVALPGASIGLGMQFTPARKLLDANASLAIGSDWNPGSAPMGDLLVQASILGAFERLTISEALAGVTYRAAMALKLADRGRLTEGQLADIAAFELEDFRDIFYNQGRIKPSFVWKRGVRIK